MTLGVTAPVHSTLTARALWRGAAAMLSGRAAGESGGLVREWLRRRFPGRMAVLFGSGTAALTAALNLAMRRAGNRRIALPGYGCYDLATAVLGAGGEALLYDLDPATLGPDWPSFDRALAGRPAAVVIAHLYGHPVDLGEVVRRLAGNPAVLIEDAAQGIGGTWDATALGGIGTLGVLSFGRGKGLTGGSGGALLLDLAQDGGPSGPEPAPSSGLVQWVKAVGQWVLARPSLYWLPANLPFLGLGDTVFRDPSAAQPIGRAALGILGVTTESVDRDAESRRETGARLSAAVTAAGLGRVPGTPAGGRSGMLRLPVVCTAQARRSLGGRAAARLGIMPGYPRALGDLEPFRPALVSPGPMPGAAALVGRLVTLPTHALVPVSDLEELLSTLSERA
jgi:DegT/DnrJ/EryC1/StrS aminotransferase family protein